MKLILYLDILFVINFIMDALLLLIVRRLRQEKKKIYRIMMAAALGAFLSCILAMYPSMPGIIKVILGQFMVCFILCFVAFGKQTNKHFLGNVMALLILGLCTGGAFSSLYDHLAGGWTDHNYKLLPILMLALLILPLLYILLAKYHKQKQRMECFYEVRLNFNGCSIEAKGLLDTGNCLSDPISGKPVILVEEKLLDHCQNGGGLKSMLLKQPERFCIVPYCSVGNPHGILHAYRLDCLEIKTGTGWLSCPGVVAAVSEGCISPKKEYQVILNADTLSLCQ